MHLRVRTYLVLAMFAANSRAQDAASAFPALAKQAQTAADAHDLPKAIDLYQRALKLKPDWPDGLWSLGSMAYDVDRYRECSDAFRKLTALKPDSAPAWTMSGLCEYRQRNYGTAIDSLARVESLNFQENPELARAARLHYALLLTKTGVFEKAITVLTDLTQSDKKSPEIIAAAGIAGLRQPWLPAEVPETQRDLVFRLGDAMASAMERDFKTSIQKFAEVAAAYPNEPNVHFRYGAVLFTQDAEPGIEEMKKALAMAPDHVPALVSLSAIYLKREDTAAALDYGQRAVKASPGDFSTHIVLGRALLAMEKPAEAAAELEQALKLAPNVPEAHFGLATAYSRLGRKEDAAREQAAFKRLEHLGGK